MIFYDKKAIFEAARRKAPGYIDAVKSLAVETETQFIVSDEAFLTLRKYEREGFGKRIEKRLKPITKWLDSKLGTKLSKCVACSKRAKKLDSIESKVRKFIADLWR